ncbi:Iron-sulfur protein IND1 [Fulvia fulva]|uniref:Iron-sulfur protein IND1 n=1 Tax=Passalora fulva TaxID=5499 RepID=A0A9Q8L5A3_PASFU|nr:Iron-sulfur protein IND1 [Fulvia fulva]KAK4634788.1 Iron-sulfur protein IND1 [Fulvia fulva]KAK4637897.1 Iron-sulfur protein IND1 [Fulvia fulva]UJO11150.1 Iron-sulfur protein IND1 [Fulvia fulva]WPV09757.1 Iron-sulfur protein IND1 [Fulvia fulva]WPV23430.1 Iron-sulfur protein IND1 [Fulvia fulva]
MYLTYSIITNMIGSCNTSRLLQLPSAIRCRPADLLLRGRLFSSTCRQTAGHENPLGLPRAGTPPNLAARMKRGLPGKKPIVNVRKVVAVSSAKGGVGKSTISTNLALAMARRGLRTGILDTDIYGPSIPTLLNLEGFEPELDSSNRLLPLTAYGVKAMSMGFLVPQDSPIAWRGLMVQKAMNQLLFEVAWPELDVLVMDLPPGTGDVQLTITQSIELDGAVIVSTPQDLALRDAVRGVEMFKKTKVPIMGMVQNMSTFTCTNCGHHHDIFGLDGARKKCGELGLDLLGDIPLDSQICSDADAGRPTVISQPESAQAAAFGVVAQALAAKLKL